MNDMDNLSSLTAFSAVAGEILVKASLDGVYTGFGVISSIELYGSPWLKIFSVNSSDSSEKELFHVLIRDEGMIRIPPWATFITPYTWIKFTCSPTARLIVRGAHLSILDLTERAGTGGGAQVQADITALQTSLATAQSEIDSVELNIVTLDASVASEKTKLTTASGKITTLEAEVTAGSTGQSEINKQLRNSGYHRAALLAYSQHLLATALGVGSGLVEESLETDHEILSFIKDVAAQTLPIEGTTLLRDDSLERLAYM